jgi:hypothetical protein
MTSHDHLPHPSARYIDRSDILSEQEIVRTAEFYAKNMAARTTGPQLESMDAEWVIEALHEDSNVLLVDVQQENGETVKWPLLTPIQYHEGYDPQYFKKHFEDRSVYYFEMPPEQSIDAVLRDEQHAARIARHIARTDAVIVYDYRENLDTGSEAINFAKEVPLFLQRATVDQMVDVTPNNIAYGVDYGPPSAIYYEGRAVRRSGIEPTSGSIQEAVEKRTMADGKLLPLPDSNTALLHPDHMKDEPMRRALWDMYLKQFLNMGANHPIHTHSPREEFVGLLSNPKLINVVTKDESGPAGLFRIAPPGECVWLNPEYYHKKYEDEAAWVGFATDIVVAEGKARLGLGYAQKMMGNVTEVITDAGMDFVVAFGCTGVSRTYMPKITAGFFAADPSMELLRTPTGEHFEVAAQYEYRMLARG